MYVDPRFENNGEIPIEAVLPPIHLSRERLLFVRL